MSTRTPIGTGRRAVVVGVDNSAASAAAVRWAAAEASRLGTVLQVVHVHEHDSHGAAPCDHADRDTLSACRQRVMMRLGSWLAPWGSELDISVSVARGRVCDRLCRSARGARMLVLGAADGPEHELLAHELSGRCECPVVVVDEPGHASYVPRRRAPDRNAAATDHV